VSIVTVDDCPRTDVRYPAASFGARSPELGTRRVQGGVGVKESSDELTRVRRASASLMATFGTPATAEEGDCATGTSVIVDAGSPAEDLLRLAELTGAAPVEPGVIRRAAPGVRVLCADGSALPWSLRQSPEGDRWAEAIPLRLTTVFKWGREDHDWSVYRFIEDFDWTKAYLFGLQKVSTLRGQRMLRFGAEVADLHEPRRSTPGAGRRPGTCTTRISATRTAARCSARRLALARTRSAPSWTSSGRRAG
jgi:hypothetical protein